MAEQQSTGQQPQSGGMGQFLVKALIAGVIIVAGVAGGIYTGSAINQSAGMAPEQLRNTTFLEIGDEFPDYKLWDEVKGAEYTVSEIVADGPALLLFVSYNCPACHTMMRQWEKRVLPELDPDIRLYMVFDDAEVAPEGGTPMVPDAANVSKVLTNRGEQRGEDGITATPTLVAVGKDHTIKFISTGYMREIDAEYIAEHM